MPRFQKAVGFLKAALRSQIVPRASVTAKQAKDPLSPAVQAIAVMVMATAILVPPGWFFAHVEDYKNPSRN